MESLSGIQRNIVKEILRECFPKKLTPNEHFVAFYVKLLLLDPNWGITDNYMNTRVNIQNFVKHFITELEQENLLLSTLQMQFSFRCYLETIPEHIENNRNELLKHLYLLKVDICKTPEPKDQNEIYLLNKKIVYYITLLTGLGSPTNSQVTAEALGALKSVLDDNELKEFTNLSKQNKETQLLQLSKIVAGIRLFNKDCGKGGNSIPKLPTLLDNAVTSIKSMLQQTLLYVMANVNLLTTFVEKSYNVDAKVRLSVTKNDVRDEILYQAKELLILFRQYELSVRKLIDEVNILQDSNKSIYKKFQATLNEIHQTVQLRIAVSVNIVFPLFLKLAELWTKMQNQVIKLTVFKTIMKTLDNFVINSDIEKNFSDIQSLEVDIVSISDAERLESTARYSLVSNNPNLFILKAENVGNVDGIKIQYLGFCPWKLVHTEGALIPGNPSMGIVKYRDMNFVFSCPGAFAEFSRAPDEYIMRILTLARKMPHLILFLDIADQLEEVIDQCQLVKQKIFEKTSCENGIQTCENFEEVVPPNKDTAYKWNVWDLKRQAIKLANCSKCKTVSTQTNKTHSRVPVETQTYMMEASGTQTKIDNYTNVATPSSFIFGLRGQKDDKQVVFDITLPPTF